MPPQPPDPDWSSIVAGHARSAGIELSSQTIDELATHLEDVYLAARADGADDAAARAAAHQALATSGLAPLRAEPRVDPRRFHARSAEDIASASRSRSFAMAYALRMALRQFRLRPVFAFLVVLVIGLATGSATVIYTIVDTVVLRPLPYRAPDQLVRLWDTNTEKGLARDPFSPVTFLDYKALPVFADAAAWWRPDVSLRDPGLEPVRVKAIETSGNTFAVLGVGPQIGEGFPKDGPFYSRTWIAVISDRLWRTRYGADPGIVGRQLSFDDRPYTIAGVMPAGFHFPDDVDVWLRLPWDLAQHSRGAHFMEGVGRLRDGVSIEQARAATDTLAARLGRQFESSNKGWAFAVVPLLDDQLGYYRPALYVLVGAVGVLFLIGCLNVASLLLTRTLSREREMAVRTAIGASPRQIVIQLLAEALILSAAGAITGVLLALVALPVIVAVTPIHVPRLADAVVSGRVMALAVALVGAMTLAFGLVPSLALVRRQTGGNLRSAGRGSSRETRVVYQALIVAEVALACALLVSSALLVRTVGEMARVPTGVTGESVVLANVQLAMGQGPGAWPTLARQHAEILERVREQPGVISAGSTNILPMEHGWRNPFDPADRTYGRPEDRPQVQYHSISEGYFETMGATLIDGRAFGAHDTPESEAVVIVNETLARRYFPGRSPVGRELRETPAQVGPLASNLTWTRPADGRWTPPKRIRIVGVVRDIRNVGLGIPVEPAVYAPMRQFPFRSVTVAINARDRATAVEAVRQALKAVAPNTPLGTVETWADRLGSRTAEPRLLMTTLTAFGVMAALLAALGVYGLFSWSVALRGRELAIRLALGARPAAVGAGVVRRSAVLVAVGLILGLGLVEASRSLLASVLFGITPHDLVSLVTGGVLLFVAAVASSIPPAWRAMRVDPVEALQAE